MLKEQAKVTQKKAIKELASGLGHQQYNKLGCRTEKNLKVK